MSGGKSVPQYLLAGIAAGAVLIAALLLAGSWNALVDKVMFPSPHTGRRTGNLTLRSGAAELDAFWLPGRPGGPVILYSHGNGEILSGIHGLLSEYARRGYGVLGYDYAGYGGSTGKAGEEQACRDIDAAYAFLTRTKGIPPERITLVGFSIGCGPSCYAAEKYPVRAVVLLAPFASALQTVFPFPLPFDRFPNARRMSATRRPLLVFHGRKDRIIPFRNGEKVYAMAAGTPKKFIPLDDTGHNDLFPRLGETFWTELAAFARRSR
ncbi:MAG: alpha/beta hydrolase [Lentisphaeria bacterium]|nr:alpha/beta hydrolase [Lentisphaeria bacterium]